MKEPAISLTQVDALRLESLLNQEALRTNQLNDHLEELENELARAEIVEMEKIPKDLITMNTRFSYLNVTDNKVCEMSIVYPNNSNTELNQISVLAPLGAAMIGLREGEEIEWGFPDGITKKLRILKVIYQPESKGDYHL